MTIHLSFPEFPEYWKRTSEEYATASDAIRRLEELEREYLQTKGTHVCVNLEKTADDVMTVGLAGTRWLLIHTLGVDEQYYSRGGSEIKGETHFMTPEGVDFSNSHLLPVTIAKEVLTRWISDDIEHDTAMWTTKMA
ncbi:MAG: hypothetical protein DWQ34_04030 [Planctomycetota bacterium]|nr:MAG: hypothetical protein DWQ34_04030 [Planctomycetota bacterium]REK29684.1 MAG: hypothetical protein DWQ41_03335 [Planctomycetota bacterium]REK30495.1 MAG: hypothetical protein DWQ45_21700 [Planctomycetota bacterium]